MRLVPHTDPVSPVNRRLLGEKTGLIARVDTSLPARGGPRAYTASSVSPDIARSFDHIEEFSISGGGKGDSQAQLVLSAMGETVERYALWLPDEHRVLEASYAELDDGEHVPPFEYLTFYGQDQGVANDHYLSAVTEETVVTWCDATHLGTGEQWYLPANFVWFYSMCTDAEQHYFGLTTNGAAAHRTSSRALLGGLYEIVERDGFMRTWCTRTPPPRVDTKAIPEIDRFIRDRMPDEQFTLHLLDLPSPVEIPAYAAAITKEADAFPKFLMGAAANIDPIEAMKGAVYEALQGWPSILKTKYNRDVSDLDLDSHIANLDDNAALYGYPEHFDGVRFLVEGDVFVPDHDRRAPANEYRAVLGHLLKQGYTPIGVDLTTPDVADAGFRVVRAYVPELIPLTEPAYPPRGHPALDGVDPSPTPPHPFP